MKALIVDDEPMPAKDLAYMIEKHCFEILTVEICNSGPAALELLEKRQYDVIFLDIEMPGMTGFDLIEHAKLPSSTQVIFTTAYEQYAVEAFKVNAVHYLVKPVNHQELIQAVRKVMLEKKKRFSPRIDQEKLLSVYDGNTNHIIKQEEIIHLEADGNYTSIYLKDGRKLLSSKNLRHFEGQIDENVFFRPHRSHIINLKKVVQIGNGKASIISMSNGDDIPLAKGKRDILEKALGL